MENDRKMSIADALSEMLKQVESISVAAALTNRLKSVKKSLVPAIAEDLLREKGVTTTLDIKAKLIESNPDVNWTQEFVSETMKQVHEGKLIPKLNFIDNGTYREYFTGDSHPHHKKTPPTPSPIAVIPCSNTDLIQVIIDNAGRHLKIGWFKKKGEFREGTFMTNTSAGSFMDTLGYIIAFDVDSVDLRQKRIDPRRVEYVEVDNTRYTRNS